MCFAMKDIVQLLMLIWCQCYCVEVHFETTDSGFFLKPNRQTPVVPEISNIQPSLQIPTAKIQPYDYLLSVDRFTVVQTSQAVSIRASYGPFSTKQTIPARFIIPEHNENPEEFLSNSTAALIDLQKTNLHFDISAHLVQTQVPQDRPVLRILFHSGADPGGHLKGHKLCVLLYVSMGTKTPLKGRCIPEGEDGVCVAEVVIPSHWFPSILYLKRNDLETFQKMPQKWVQVSYSVFEPSSRNPEQCEPKVQIQPITIFAHVPLVHNISSFKTLNLDDHLILLIPQRPIYPLYKMHVLVLLHLHSYKQISVFTLRARVKSGIKILGASSSSDLWNISYEKENQKHTTARVTALKIDKQLRDEHRNVTEKDNRVIEVFSWRLDITDDDAGSLDEGKIVWSAKYVFNNYNNEDSIEKTYHKSEETKKRLVYKFEISKDDIQAVLPMAKSWELINTAALTGRQVSQAMKVFIVTEAGKVADVTLQSSCITEDESVVKVSSSCSSVYVDGSEIRGSSNASIIVKYGTYIGVAKFIVWMPEFPLEVYIPDCRLSQIKGWRVLEENNYFNSKQTRQRKKRSFNWRQHASSNNVGSEKSCRTRYQQSPVDVYARFLAIDQNSGRIRYFISRRTVLRITDLVESLLRVADPKIASLNGRILQGKSMGRTDVQVVSPITGRVIGAKEVRVGSDKVMLTKLIVRVVSGLQLTIISDNVIANGYISETSVTQTLTAQYQEGLLDIDLEFSDGLRSPLREIAVKDYFLLVESLDTEVVAFAPMLASHHPRVIAVGEGNGDLLRVTLLLSEDCRVPRSIIPAKQKMPASLASALASVQVDFNNAKHNVNKQESVQNDGIIGKDKKIDRFNGDLADIIGIPLSETNLINEPKIKSRSFFRNKLHIIERSHGQISGITNLTSLEAGLYILLTAFCFAIILFIITCVIYASKFKAVEVSDNNDTDHKTTKSNCIRNGVRVPYLTRELTTNVHDWVWLGRSALEKTFLVNENLNDFNFNSNEDSQVRKMNKPIFKYFNTSKKTENGNLKRNSSDLTYAPPVPPRFNVEAHKVINHADIHAPSIGNHKVNILEKQKPYEVRKKQMILLKRTNFENCTSTKTSSEVVFSPNNNNDSSLGHEHILHNAEKILQNSKTQKNQNIFQFDSLTPTENSQRRVLDAVVYDANAANVSCENEFCKHHQASRTEAIQVKRATVIGNSIFSAPCGETTDKAEVNGLECLDMNYNEIMQYFKNLKESNA